MPLAFTCFILLNCFGRNSSKISSVTKMKLPKIAKCNKEKQKTLDLVKSLKNKHLFSFDTNEVNGNRSQSPSSRWNLDPFASKHEEELADTTSGTMRPRDTFREGDSGPQETPEGSVAQGSSPDSSWQGRLRGRLRTPAADSLQRFQTSDS